MSFMCPLCVGRVSNSHKHFFPFDLDSASGRDCIFFVKVNISTTKLPYRTMCDLPVLPSAEDGLNLVDNGEEMG